MASPPLFVYPGPYRFADGRALTSPQTMDAGQITTGIPDVPALAGVVLMVYWSTICPTPACDFSLIAKTIGYWHARGKHVVLAVATNGFPIRVKSAGPGDIEGATPEWVMRQIKTYSFSSRVLGGLPGEQDRVTQLNRIEQRPKRDDLVLGGVDFELDVIVDPGQLAKVKREDNANHRHHNYART